jgi:hypothetical protein
MRATLKILTALLGLGLVILLLLHLFLQFGLTRALQETVLPRIKEEQGIDIRVGRLSINIPRGFLTLKEVAVRNPEGFLLENAASVERIRVEFDLLSLIRKDPVLIRSIEVERVLLNIIRNREGEVNLSRFVPPSVSVEDTASRPPPAAEPEQVPVQAPEQMPAGEEAGLPEVLIRGMLCDAQVRYLDFKLNQLELVLDLGVTGSGLSTLRDPDQPWGQLTVIGSLGSDRTRFVTDLKLLLAPLSDPRNPSFDLTGRMMEIDPRLLEEAYSKLGIRSAPFGLDTDLHCRDGRFERSMVGLTLRNIEMEKKLADRLGGMASIESLRFPVPVTGTLQEPSLDFEAALLASIGGNTETLLDAFFRGAAAKEAGLEQPPETLSDAAVEVLGAKVNEIGGNEAAKKALKDLVDGRPASTNETGPLSSDVLVEILGEEVEEIGENEALKDELKSLGKWLFGK